MATITPIMRMPSGANTKDNQKKVLLLLPLRSAARPTRELSMAKVPQINPARAKPIRFSDTPGVVSATGVTSVTASAPRMTDVTRNPLARAEVTSPNIANPSEMTPNSSVANARGWGSQTKNNTASAGADSQADTTDSIFSAPVGCDTIPPWLVNHPSCSG